MDPIPYEPKIVELNKIEVIDEDEDEDEDVVVDNKVVVKDDSPENNQIELDF